jgi:RHS repeat-associated protein
MQSSRDGGDAGHSGVQPAFRTLKIPKIELPKGGGAVRSIDEKFRVNAANGTSSYSIPLPFQRSRAEFGPHLVLHYNSGSGNGPYGIGWADDLASISRSTARRLAAYDDGDIFQLTGHEDLVPAMRKQSDGTLTPDTDDVGDYHIVRYRPRIEGAFARIECIQRKGEAAPYWRVMPGDGTVTIYGRSAAARIADPGDASRVFRWLPEWSFDDRGNCFEMEYKLEDLIGVPATPSEILRLTGGTEISNRYLKRIRFGNQTPYPQPDTAHAYDPTRPAIGHYFFQVVFDYGEHDAATPAPADAGNWTCRGDPFSNYRSGFDIRTYRLVRRILFFNNFDELAGKGIAGPWVLVRALELEYAVCNFGPGPLPPTEADRLIRVHEVGTRPDGAGGYSRTALPPLTFTYQSAATNLAVHLVSRDQLPNAPTGLASPAKPVDLFGDGLTGLLSEVGNDWYYQENTGSGFSRAHKLWSKPSLQGVGDGTLQIRDLEADGAKQIVIESTGLAGYYELDADNTYRRFQHFLRPTTAEAHGPRRKLIDLDGDGRPEIVISDNDEIIWLENLGRDGHGRWFSAPLPPGEGSARMIFADEDEGVHLADMTGDGLVDIVRVRSDSIAYWPNLGFGRFGAMIEMDSPPIFDHPDQFDPRRLQLADLSGTGPNDLVYLSRRGPRFAINMSGNGWTSPQLIEGLADAKAPGELTVIDLFGQGTPCLVLSSTLAINAAAPIRYVDLYGGRKPYIVSTMDNGAGSTVALRYRCSTLFYLEDKAAGRPWITKLPFPVQCVASVETREAVTNSLFVTTYRYRHGYYDRDDREFRGFACVEETDSESYDHLAGAGAKNAAAPDLHEDPVLKRTWFHTGAFPGMALQDSLAPEFYPASGLQLPDFTLVGEEIASGRPEDRIESHRVLKGRLLREEIYALDATPEAAIPYSIAWHGYRIRAIQPRGDRQFGVFQCLETESATAHLERQVDDPRIAHTINISFDDHGNVLQSATVAYGRRATPTDSDPDVLAAQQASAVMISTTRLSADIIDAGTYRLRVGCENASYELAGSITGGAFATANGLMAAFANAADAPYGGPFPTGTYKRLTRLERTLYASDANIGQAAPLGSCGARALLHESYHLVLTESLRTSLYGSDVSAADVAAAGFIDGSTLAAQGLFPSTDPKGQWWSASGHVEYPADPVAAFYRPAAFVDALGSRTQVREYKTYFLLLDQITDALGNTTTATEIDFFIVQPRAVRDINDAVSAVRYDRLGLVAGTAIGKGAAGDSFQNFDPDLSDADVDAFFADPVGQARHLLQHATSRVITDHRHVPNWNAVIGRAVHDSVVAATGVPSPLQIAFAFTDGLGRVTLRKLQAEPGPAKSLRSDGTVVEVDTSPNPRWVGDGRVVVNNKSDPVLAFQPYFSTTHRFDDANSLGASGHSMRRHYDPLGRPIAIEHPDGSREHTEFDCWSHTHYDRNDTVLGSSWYSRRSAGGMGADAQDAALKAAVHDNTPSIVHIDALGHAVANVVANRQIDRTTGLPVDEDLITRFRHDIEGNVLSVTDPKGIEVVRYRYDMAETQAEITMADAGRRWRLSNAMGAMALAGDAKLNRMRAVYDALHRPTRFKVKPSSGSERTTGVHEYGTAADKPINANGRLTAVYDSAGLLTTTGYDFKGNIRENRRRFLADPRVRPDWTNIGAVALLPATHTTAMTYDALNRIITMSSPDTTVETFSYNESNLLESVSVKLPGQAERFFVENIDYTAKGQRLFIQYGNGTETRYDHDEETDRLAGITTKRLSDNTLLQALAYTYDPVGNVTGIRDNIADTVYFNNQAVPGSGGYTYDAAYRLIAATGREHTAANRPPDWADQDRINLPQKADGNALQLYEQLYSYDGAGNMQRIRHNGGRGALALRWTRDFTIAGDSNRLLDTRLGTDTETFNYDAQGNVTGMRHLDQVDWNEENQLVEVHTHAGAKVFHGFDSEGNRIRKYIVRSDGTTEDRIYVGRWERSDSYRANGSLRVSRETLHVLDDSKRIALIERRTAGADAGAALLIAYQYGNAIGSALLELNEAAVILSYEEYYPYGSTSLQSVSALRKLPPKRYRFTGKERDEETGFYYHGARFYAPWLCRWTSPDPAGIADGANMYSYSGNRPIGSSDPTGMWEMPSWRTVAVVTAVVVVGAVVTVATAGAAAPIVAGAVASIGLSGAAATVATGVVVGAVSGAVAGAASGAAGELTRQTVNSKALGLGNEQFSAGRVLKEAASGAKTGAMVGAAIGGAAAFVSTAAGAAAIGGAGKLASSVAGKVVPGVLRQGGGALARGVAAGGQRIASTAGGQLVKRGTELAARGLQQLERASMQRGAQFSRSVFREGSIGRVAAERVASVTRSAESVATSKLFSSNELMGVERASPELLEAVAKHRTVVIARPGSEELRMLEYFQAEASVGGENMTHILVRENPSKAALLEEFLHGTQQRLGVVDRLGRTGLGSAETHVKDFMIRHQKLLGLSQEDVGILQILKDKGL